VVLHAILAGLLLAAPLALLYGYFRARRSGVATVKVPIMLYILFLAVFASFAFLQLTDYTYATGIHVTSRTEGRYEISFVLRNRSLMPIRLELLLFDVIGEYRLEDVQIDGNRLAGGHRVESRQAVTVTITASFAMPLDDTALGLSYLTGTGQRRVLRLQVPLP